MFGKKPTNKWNGKKTMYHYLDNSKDYEGTFKILQQYK